jgi:hypothetical protein
LATTRTITHIPTGQHLAWAVAWTLANAEAGDQLEMPGASDRSVQVSGTFGGATAVLQGSNDGVTWNTLTDPQGNALSFTAGGLEAVLELTRYVRPSVSGGDGTTSVAFVLCVAGRVKG